VDEDPALPPPAEASSRPFLGFFSFFFRPLRVFLVVSGSDDGVAIWSADRFLPLLPIGLRLCLCLRLFALAFVRVSLGLCLFGFGFAFAFAFVFVPYARYVPVLVPVLY